MLYIILMWISHFMFSWLMTLLAVYFIFILDYRNDVRQKVNSSVFFFEFKMCHKAMETTGNISNTFGPGTANEHAVQWQFKKFCKGDESLEDEERSGQPSEVDNNRVLSLKLILLQLHEKLPKNSVLTILQSLAFETNWKDEKTQ